MQYISFVFFHIFVFRTLKVVNIETGQSFETVPCVVFGL